ncbi:MAG TPA: hypothetical protein VNH83_28235 [Bryobacteraceae bacterium]|nr:hypothetical protein [Bryobacteraceae bacterium]
MSEIVSAAWEQPDAIGWKGGWSTLVECKATRADFLKQAHKHTTANGTGAGTKRFFLCPPAVIDSTELQGTDYGLLYLMEDGRIKVIREALHRNEVELRREVDMLVSALRRVRTREFITIVTEAPDATNR